MRTMWMALLLWAAPTQGVSTNCVIPAVEELQNTSLTCSFSDDISKLKQDFKVQFYKSNRTDSSEEILYCYWMDNKPECQVHKCCEYDGHVTETLTVRVLNVTKALVGNYVCFVLPAAADSSSFCNFTLREKQTDTPGNNPATIAVPIVIVIAVISCIIIILWKLKCSKKAEDKTTKKKTCNFWPVEWCSAKEKLGDEESIQPLNESKDEAINVSQSTNVPDSKDRSPEKYIKSTDPNTTENLGQKSHNTDGSDGPVYTNIIESIRTLSELETKPEEIEKGHTEVKKSSISDVKTTQALNKLALSERRTNADVESCGSNATVSQNPSYGSDLTPHNSLSEQSLVLIHRADQSRDDGTRTTRETSQTLQTEDERKDQKEQKSDVYNCSKVPRRERKKALIKEKAAQDKAEVEQKIAKDKAEEDENKATEKAEKEEKLVKENAEKEEKLVKENAEKEETIAKAKAEKLEKKAKEEWEKEERLAKDKAKEELKIAKDKAEQEEKKAKRFSKIINSTSTTLEKQVKNISNEKKDQMKKIEERKEEQMKHIATERTKELKNIAKEKGEELKKIANMREEQLQEISKKKSEEIEKIGKKKEEKMEKIRKKKEFKMEKIRKEKEERTEAIKNENLKKNETIKKKGENQSEKKGKGRNQTAVLDTEEALKVIGEEVRFPENTRR